MPSYLINILKYLISFGFAFALFAYLYQDEDMEMLFANIWRADMKWIGLSIIAAVVSHASRALRWNIALSPLGYAPRFIPSFLATMSGYFINIFVPRLGEVMRCGLLNRIEKVPVNISFGAVIAERAIDLIILLSLTATILLVEFDKLGDFLVQQLQSSSGLLINKVYILAGIGVMGIISLVTIYLLRARLLKLAIVQKGATFLVGLKEGLLSIRKLSRQQQIAYILHTMNIWMMYYLMSYLLFFSTPETSHLSPLCALSTLIMGGIGMALPSPGGIGTYHIFVSTTFIAYGLSETIGKDFAFLMHSTQTIGIIVLGGISFALAMAFPKKA